MKKPKILPKVVVPEKVRIQRSIQNKKHWHTQRGYFDNTEEALIREYKGATHDRRNEIYKLLHPRFEYLVTSLLFRFRIPLHFDDIDFIKQDCLCNILEGIEKFDPNKRSKNTHKTSKFYSYCSVIVSNHLRQLIKKRKNKFSFDESYAPDFTQSKMNTHTLTKYVAPPSEDVTDDLQDQLALKEFLTVLRDKMPEWDSMLSKENDRSVLRAMMQIFDDSEALDHAEKKEVYFLLKELTGLKPQQINGSLKNIRKIYAKIKEEYLSAQATKSQC